MPARRSIPVVCAVLLALGGAGCGDRDPAPLPPETQDAFYIQGKQLQKQGRNAEALNAFLKVIDRRGEHPSPESHLEAGLTYLHHTKDYLAACYHFRRYLKAYPNSKEAALVLGKIDEAKREFARTLPGRPLEDQSMRFAADEEIGRLRRENEELRAEVAVLRGGGAVPVGRVSRMITLPPEMQSAPPPVARVIEAPVTAAPSASPPARPPVGTAPVIQRLPPPAAVAPARPPAAPPTAAKAAAPAGRSHTVVPKDTLYSIARRYNVKVEDIVAANRAALPRVNTPLRVGQVLKIP